MEKKIFELLNKIGCPCHIKGRVYIETAINIVFENGDMPITKELYPKIAKIHNTTPSRVERAIRHAIKASFTNGDPNIHEKVFGNTISLQNSKVTNHSFVCGVVKFLKLYGDD